MAALAALLVTTGCSGGGSSSPTDPGGNNNNNNNPTVTTTGTVVIGVTDALGTGIAGVTVTAGALNGTTTGDGVVTWSNVAAASSLQVSFVKAGYAPTVKSVPVVAGQTSTLAVVMLPVGNTASSTTADTQAITCTDEVTLANANTASGSVALQAGSALKADNTVATDVQVAFTAVVPASESTYLAAFPGKFLGVPTGSTTPVAIESFGYATVSLTDSAGNPLHLDENKPARLEIPVDSANDPVDATIPLWSLDETTGLWKAEGNATRATRTNGTVYYWAEVKHFSTFNLDRPIAQGMTVQVTVKQTSNAVVAGAQVTVISNSSAGAWQDVGVSDANGLCTFATVPAGNVSVVVTYGGKTASAYGYDVAGNTASMTVFLPGAVTVKVVDVNGAAVPGATVNASSHGAGGFQQQSATTNANGECTFDNLTLTGLMLSATKGDLSGYGDGPYTTMPIVIKIQ
jgi:hypothetical protein